MQLQGRWAIASLLLSGVFFISCSQNSTMSLTEKDTVNVAFADSTKSVSITEQPANLNYTPNELGKVMVLEYHLIGY